VCCEKQVCYECKQHYEIIALWDMTGEPLKMLNSYPRIEDSIYIFCDITTQDVERIESIGTKDTFWIKFGDLHVLTTLNTKCEEKD